MTIPELIYGTNLRLPDHFQFYRIICSLALVPDFLFSEQGYVPATATGQAISGLQATDWLLARKYFPGAHLSPALPEPSSDSGFVFILSVAIQLGVTSADGYPEPVRYQGAGKILKVTAAVKKLPKDER